MRPKLSVAILVSFAASSAHADIVNYESASSDLDLSYYQYIFDNAAHVNVAYSTNRELEVESFSESFSDSGSFTAGAISSEFNTQGISIAGELNTSSTLRSDFQLDSWFEGRAYASSSASFVLEEVTEFSFETQMSVSQSGQVEYRLSNHFSGETYFSGNSNNGDTGEISTITLGPGEYRYSVDMWSTSNHSFNYDPEVDFAIFNTEFQVIPAPGAFLLAPIGFLSFSRRRR